MRLYLSSFRNGNHPNELLELLDKGRRTALIPNAIDHVDVDDRRVSLEREVERLEQIGLEPETMDLRDYFGKPDALKQELANFDLVWARGGNSFLLRRAFRQSGAENVMAEFLADDELVYGGYSAGAVLLTPSLRGIELVDDPHVVPPNYDKAVIWEGLGLIPYAIAPHYRSEHPESADIERSVEYMIDNHVPFVALRDGEAIVVDGDKQSIASSRATDR